MSTKSSSPKAPPLGLYIHVPFCKRKCGYCAFASASPGPGDVDEWLRGVILELDRRLTPDLAARVTTVFVGGGNPTSIGSAALTGLIETVSRRLSGAPLAEWTFETNPESLDGNCIEAFSRVPALRLSIGAQRLRDDEITGLGREGTVALVFRALERALDLTSRVGLDLILGVPGFPSLAPDLDTLLARFPVAHLSTYFLSAEPDTPLGEKVQEGIAQDPADEGPEELFEVSDLLARHGFEQYEISNFARHNERCRHNLLYWNGDEYLGIGPAAVSTIGDDRLTNPDTLSAWLAGTTPERETLDRETRRREYLMLRLRLLADGLDLTEYAHRFGPPSPSLREALHRQRVAGLLSETGATWRLTRSGLAIANQVIADLF